MRESNGFSLMLRGDSGLGLEWIEVGAIGDFCSPFFPFRAAGVLIFSSTARLPG